MIPHESELGGNMVARSGLSNGFVTKGLACFKPANLAKQVNVFLK